jgi:hypothetical protein
MSWYAGEHLSAGVTQIRQYATAHHASPVAHDTVAQVQPFVGLDDGWRGLDGRWLRHRRASGQRWQLAAGPELERQQTADMADLVRRRLPEDKGEGAAPSRQG